MAISNKFGLMVVTTGNKSEMSVGYATLYGDMNGGFNPIKDLYKTEVYRLWRACATAGSRTGRSVPTGRSSRRTSSRARRRAELAPEPEGPGHAAALRRARRDPASGWSSARSRSRTSSPTGFDRDVVVKVERMLNLAEYKRRQAAPGVKVTLKNFGRDRRYPITNRFRDPGTPLPKPDRSLVSAQASAPRARRSIFESRSSTRA